MRQITESESTPKADGFYMPAEFAPQDRVFMGWPNRPDTFAFGAVPAQRTYAGIADAISEFTPVVMCCNEADYDNCKAVFKDNERVTVMEMSINDAWFRDTGATFLVNGKTGTSMHTVAWWMACTSPGTRMLKSRVKWPTTWGFARIVPTM